MDKKIDTEIKMLDNIKKKNKTVKGKTSIEMLALTKKMERDFSK